MIYICLYIYKKMAVELPVEIMEKMRNLMLTDVKEYSLAGTAYIAKIVDIYDGDSCKVIIYRNGEFVRYTCRLLGIDAPEIKLKTSRAFQARNRLIQLVTNYPIDLESTSNHTTITHLLQQNTKLVVITCDKFDKYGRLLIRIYPSMNTKDPDAAITLIKEGYGYDYDGGTKHHFE
jgi:endonuclease YncB( thermonuclease family)